MTAEIINFVDAKRVGPVQLPPLKLTRTGAFYCVYGGKDFAARVSRAVRIMFLVPKDVFQTGRDFDLDDCNAFLDRYANQIDAVCVTQGDRLRRLVCVAEVLPDSWMLTFVVEIPRWDDAAAVERLRELPGMPPILSLGVLATPTAGFPEESMLLFRIGALDDEVADAS